MLDTFHYQINPDAEKKNEFINFFTQTEYDNSPEIDVSRIIFSSPLLDTWAIFKISQAHLQTTTPHQKMLLMMNFLQKKMQVTSASSDYFFPWSATRPHEVPPTKKPKIVHDLLRTYAVIPHRTWNSSKKQTHIKTIEPVFQKFCSGNKDDSKKKTVYI